MQNIEGFEAKEIKDLAENINEYLQEYPNMKITKIVPMFDNSSLFYKFKVLVCFEEK